MKHKKIEEKVLDVYRKISPNYRKLENIENSSFNKTELSVI